MSVATRPGLPSIEMPALESCDGVLRSDVWTAVDRPARLEVELAVASRHSPDVPDAWRVGRPLTLALADDSLFQGVVSRAGIVWDRGGSRIRVVAYDGFEERRERIVGSEFFQVTDSEVARRLTFELGLTPSIDETSEVFDRLVVEHDPLSFLRQRARMAGFEFGVARGQLIFRQTLPEPGSRTIVGPRDVSALQIDDRGWVGRGGRVSLLGNAGWQLLDVLDLRGFGSFADGAYRVVRCRQEIDGSGFRTTLDFMEHGIDMARWEAGGREVDDA